MQFCVRRDARTHRTRGDDTTEMSPIGPDIGWAGWATERPSIGRKETGAVPKEIRIPTRLRSRDEAGFRRKTGDS